MTAEPERPLSDSQVTKMAEAYSSDAVELAANGLLAKPFGRYLGEVLRRHHGGSTGPTSCTAGTPRLKLEVHSRRG